MKLIRRPYDALTLRDEFDKVLDSFFNFDQENTTKGNIWAPTVDVSDDKDNFYITAEIPGIAKEDVKVNIKNDTLTICGEKSVNKEDKEKNFYRAERVYGSFSRSFNLPEAVDKDKIKAEYKNGILTLVIPKKEEEKPKEIDIKIS